MIRHFLIEKSFGISDGDAPGGDEALIKKNKRQFHAQCCFEERLF